MKREDKAPSASHMRALSVLCDTRHNAVRHPSWAQYGNVITAVLTLPGPLRAARVAFMTRALYALGTRVFALQCVLDQCAQWWDARPRYRVFLAVTREVCDEQACDTAEWARRTDARAFHALLDIELPDWKDGRGNPSLN